MSTRTAGLILLAVFVLIAATCLIGGCENHDGDSMALTADAALVSHNSADSIGNAACVSNREADAALADSAIAVAQLMETAKQNAFVIRTLRDCAAALRARPQERSRE